MTSIDDLKKIAKEAFETLGDATKEAVNTIADVSTEAYRIAEEKAKAAAKWTKLNTESARDKALIRRLHSEIGEIYYGKHKDDPTGSLQQHCDDITDALDRIAARQKELDDLKNSGGYTDADFKEHEPIQDEDDEL